MAGLEEAAAPIMGFLEERRNRMLVSAMIASFAALALSTRHEYWYMFYTCILVALALAIKALPRSWGGLFFLAFVYLAAFGGSVLMFIMAEEGMHFYLTAMIVEVFGIYVAYIYVRRVKEFRDLAGEGEYVPLGIWAAMVLFFFMFSNLSVIAWAYWAMGTIELWLYIAFEGVLILVTFYVLFVPEELHWKREFITETIAKGGIRMSGEHCPACGAEMEVEIRLCPECGSPSDFLWCPDSEEYVSKCPKCGELLTLGTGKCKSCGTALHKKVVCKRCKKRNAISDWRAVRSS